MKRREFLSLLCGVGSLWFDGLPTASGQPSTRPVIGHLSNTTQNNWSSYEDGFRAGLGENGFVDGQNVLIEHRWAEGQYNRLPELAADLIGRKVAVILAAGGSEPAKIAKEATATIPIVFISAADPIKERLVASLNRPEGNITGVSLLGSALEAKRLGLLEEIAPKNALIGILLNPKYPDADLQVRELQEAASVIKKQISIARVSSSGEIDAAIANLAQIGAGGILVTQDPFLNARREQIVALAARYKLPAIYPVRIFAESGGLVSYGTDFADAYRQAGVYVGKILKGTKPADLPVMQPTKFGLVINMKTAKELGIAMSPNLIARADEVIE